MMMSLQNVLANKANAIRIHREIPRRSDTGLDVGRSEAQRQAVRELLDHFHNNFGEFVVTFVKCNGEARVLRGRLWCFDGLQEGSLPDDADTDHLVTIYDVEARGYRSVNLNTIVAVGVEGTITINVLVSGETVTQETL